MATAKKTTFPKKRAAAKSATELMSRRKLSSVYRTLIWPVKRLRTRVRGLLLRRPHRSFRRTRRRDYIRSLKLPGYWAFTNDVRGTLWTQKKLFTYLVLVYGILTIALVGMASQDTYAELGDTLRSTGGEVFQGNWGEIGKAGLMLASGLTGALSSNLTEAQQIYAATLVLLTWLATVWLLRAILAGRKPKLRDSLYSAGAPILPTFLVGVLLVAQLLPIVLAVVGFGAASSSGLLDKGVESMIFWTLAALLTALSLYWITSTLIALVVVTLPGMYPMQAIKTAGDLVIGRRIRILLRLLWLLVMLALLWMGIMIPIILFDTWLKSVLPIIEWLPLVPIALLAMGTLSVIWAASYIYLLYRRVVDDDTAPA